MSKQQPKSLNSLRFTYDREMNFRARVTNQKHAFPTTVLLLTATALQPSEVRAIQDHLVTAATSTNVIGEGTEFSISTMLFVDHMNQKGIKSHEAIDDFVSGQHDIFDLVAKSEKRVIETFLSPHDIFKFLNGHDKRVDKMKIRKIAGSQPASTVRFTSEKIEIPTVFEARRALGLLDDDDDLDVIVDQEV